MFIMKHRILSSVNKGLFIGLKRKYIGLLHAGLISPAYFTFINELPNTPEYSGGIVSGYDWGSLVALGM